MRIIPKLAMFRQITEVLASQQVCPDLAMCRGEYDSNSLSSVRIQPPVRFVGDHAKIVRCLPGNRSETNSARQSPADICKSGSLDMFSICHLLHSYVTLSLGSTACITSLSLCKSQSTATLAARFKMGQTMNSVWLLTLPLVARCVSSTPLGRLEPRQEAASYAGAHTSDVYPPEGSKLHFSTIC